MPHLPTENRPSTATVRSRKFESTTPPLDLTTYQEFLSRIQERLMKHKQIIQSLDKIKEIFSTEPKVIQAVNAYRESVKGDDLARSHNTITSFEARSTFFNTLLTDTNSRSRLSFQKNATIDRCLNEKKDEVSQSLTDSDSFLSKILAELAIMPSLKNPAEIQVLCVMKDLLNAYITGSELSGQFTRLDHAFSILKKGFQSVPDAGEWGLVDPDLAKPQGVSDLIRQLITIFENRTLYLESTTEVVLLEGHQALISRDKEGLESILELGAKERSIMPTKESFDDQISSQLNKIYESVFNLNSEFAGQIMGIANKGPSILKEDLAELQVLVLQLSKE